ncbi:MAG: hypothetical protein JSW52_00175, partial [Candidatus Coatesbacteria bacterium]
GDSALSYTVRFENMADATAPAQEVIVTDTLDENLDWSTFLFGHAVPGFPTTPKSKGYSPSAITRRW